MRQIKDKGIDFVAFYDNFAIFNHLPSHLVGNIQNEKMKKLWSSAPVKVLSRTEVSIWNRGRP